jgi:cobalt/nickel transport system permease protein
VNLQLDAYAGLQSPLHRWEPRCKFVGLVALMLAFSLVQDLRLLPAMLAVAAVLYGLSTIPWAFILNRLRAPGLYLLIVALVLPFLSGSTVLLTIGPLALRQEGLLELLLIVEKFTSILTVGLLLFGTAPFLSAIESMRSLGLPPILADMTLLTYRYIFEIGRDLSRMEIAMRLRGFRARWLSASGLGALAALVGSILVRSYEQSERVYRAMILRGYGQPSPTRMAQPDVQRSDTLAAAGCLLLAVTFVAAEALLH